MHIKKQIHKQKHKSSSGGGFTFSHQAANKPSPVIQTDAVEFVEFGDMKYVKYVEPAQKQIMEVLVTQETILSFQHC